MIFDLVYHPRRTRLIRQAEAVGQKAVGGLPMLVHQAVAAFAFWTGHEPTAAVMAEAAHKLAARRRDDAR